MHLNVNGSGALPLTIEIIIKTSTEMVVKAMHLTAIVFLIIFLVAKRLLIVPTCNDPYTYGICIT